MHNHGVTCTAVLEATRTLFALPEEVKRTLQGETASRGYQPMFAETLDPNGQKRGDAKETFSVGPELASSPFDAPNIWPEDPRLVNKIRAYRDSVRILARRLVGIIALSLGLESDFFDAMLSKPIELLRLIHYAPEKSDLDNGLLGAGAHSDYGMITVLLIDQEKALQVWDESTGDWMTLDLSEFEIGERLVVNIGDMLMRWTNDLYKSTRHRVVNCSGNHRYAAPFFFEPNFDTLVETIETCCSEERPRKYEPVVSGHYLMAKYESTYQAINLD